MKTTRSEFEMIVKIAERAEAMYEELGVQPPERTTLLMDIEHAHADIPMDLLAFLMADSGNFAHDIGGIVRHMDRTTGKLGDCFVPRFAL